QCVIGPKRTGGMRFIRSAMNREESRHAREVEAGAVPAERLQRPFPRLALPVSPPFPPMEAKLVDAIPRDEGWQYEPKWDGFRCLAFKTGAKVVLQSKSGQPLGRYF